MPCLLGQLLKKAELFRGNTRHVKGSFSASLICSGFEVLWQRDSPCANEAGGPKGRGRAVKTQFPFLILSFSRHPENRPERSFSSRVLALLLPPGKVLKKEVNIWPFSRSCDFSKWHTSGKAHFLHSLMKKPERERKGEIVGRGKNKTTTTKERDSWDFSQIQ